MSRFPYLEMNDHNAIVYHRGRAIGAYANLESSLCSIFTELLATDEASGSLVFYQMVNTRSRNTTIDLLMRRKEPELLPYWTSILKRVRKIDEKRNQIVHWHPAVFIGDQDYTIGDKSTGEVRLFAPKQGFFGDLETLSSQDMLDFISDCDIAERATNLLHMAISRYLAENDPEIRQAQREECRQPVPDPLPDSHPLSRNYKAPESPPEPSRA